MKRLIGTKDFYRKIMAVALPIMIQNAITNFVNMLDNIMVGSVGTNPMSGVSIVNQLIFVLNLALFGAMSGCGIFGAQYYGKRDHEGLRHTMRFKIMLSLALTAVGICIYILLQDKLIGLYLKSDSDPAALAETLYYAKRYLRIMLVGLVPFALGQCYASTLRETGETLHPMIGGLISVTVNLCFNWLLIFGKLGFPRLGVEGAAIATVLARFVECAFLIIWTHRHSDRHPFVQGLCRSLYVPGTLVGQIARKGTPLMLNETLFSIGIAVLNQCYSIRGLEVVAAMNITSTLSHVLSVVCMSIGSAISIIVGQQLGAGRMEEARDSAYKMAAFSVFLGIVMGLLLALLAGIFPKFYNTSDEVRSLATRLIYVFSFMQPIQAFMNASYFTIRSGGKTVITFLFDCGFVLAVMVPLAYFFGYHTNASIVTIVAIVQGSELIKCVLGYILMKKGVWLNNLVSGGEEA